MEQPLRHSFIPCFKMSREKVVTSILVICLGFIGLYFIFEKEWLLWIAFGVGILSLFSEKIANFICKGWYKVAEILGGINSKILLSLIFFVILVPVAFMARIFSKESKIQLKRKENSYFKERNHTYSKEDLESPF